MYERGLRPLSIITPPLKHTKKRGLKDNLFERGLGGEYLESTKTKWNHSVQVARSFLLRRVIGVLYLY